MTTATNRTDAPVKTRRGGIQGLLGKKAPAEPEMPAMDVAGGLTRALRGAASSEPNRRASDEAVLAALSTIESALFAVDTLRDTLEQALDVAHSAFGADDPGGRALLAESYDEIRLSIAKIIEELDARAAGLVGKNARNLDVQLGGKANYSVSAFRLDLSPKGLSLDPPRDAFASNEEVERVLAEIDSALQKADRAASAFCRDAQFLIARLPSAK